MECVSFDGTCVFVRGLRAIYMERARTLVYSIFEDAIYVVCVIGCTLRAQYGVHMHINAAHCGVKFGKRLGGRELKNYK